MRYSTALSLLSLSLSTLVFAYPQVERQLTVSCSCPGTDYAFFPMDGPSGVAGDSLQCFYPPISRCEYSTIDGLLIKDFNFGQCPPKRLISGMCPMTDLAGFMIGPGSFAKGDTLFCTYPSKSEVSNTEYFCVYSKEGVLTADGDDGFCPPRALCDGALATAPVSIDISVAAAGHPTVHAPVALYTTVSFSTLTPAVTAGGMLKERPTSSATAATETTSQTQTADGLPCQFPLWKLAAAIVIGVVLSALLVTLVFRYLWVPHQFRSSSTEYMKIPTTPYPHDHPVTER